MILILVGKSGTNLDLSILPLASKKTISPFSLQTQNSAAPVEIYSTLFSSISSSVFLKDKTSMQISGATEHSTSCSMILNLSSEDQAISATLVPYSVLIAHSERTIPFSGNKR